MEGRRHSALADASETIEGISGVTIVDQTAKIEDDEVVQCRSTLHLTFPIRWLARLRPPRDRRSRG
ncbi:dodecin domain-containing protein [Halovivax sp.]|uniref:dodecin domain-containing protein n=1 Tax=Halovivax sp. TaxID=1935978 RepID=UPI0025BD51B2|nr:dodecin domain-containing protein [Halovivax sp.]